MFNTISYKIRRYRVSGFKSPWKNANSNYFIEECNKLINIINKKIEFSNIIELISITEEVLLNQKEKAKNTDILVKIRYPYNITDHVQNMLNIVKSIFTIGRRPDIFIRIHT